MYSIALQEVFQFSTFHTSLTEGNEITSHHMSHHTSDHAHKFLISEVCVIFNQISK